MWWRVIIITLAFLLLGAHFVSFSQTEWAIIACVMPLLMFIRHNIINQLLKFTLLLSVIFIWAVTTFNFIDMRMTLSEPWLRLAMIMGGVMIFTLFAAFCTDGLNQRLRH